MNDTPNNLITDILATGLRNLLGLQGSQIQKFLERAAKLGVDIQEIIKRAEL